ncbi:hypothetical protein [Nemorincola caseinilytica]
MKKLLVAAFSMLLFNAAYAQDNSDDDGILNERIGLDGSPKPGGHDDGPHHGHWNHLTTLALSPFQYTENGVGVGLSYERALDHEGIISAYMPVIASFNVRNNNNNNYYNYYGNYNRGTDYMFYAMPGVKFYPTGMGKVKYALGPNAVVGYGRRSNYGYADPYYYTYSGTSIYYPPSYYTSNRFILGMMLNNSLNVNATPHLYIGAEMGFGFTYLDMNTRYNYNEGMKFLTQGSFKIGYTF